MTALAYYKLKEQPFGVTPDSRYLFLTPTHKDALSSLIHGIESGCGFVALIATPGLGKTTLLFQTLEILRDNARIVFLFQTISTPLDLLRALLSGLGVRDFPGNLVEMQIMLTDLLTEQSRAGRRVVLVIDEAQNLDDSVLELVRMLSNFETERHKLIQIVLSGQQQLADNIGSPELLQLRQRVSIFARLNPLTPAETTRYIAYRLQVAGYASDMPLFTKDALALIALRSEGIPRNINNLCFNALSLGSAMQQKPIDRDIIRRVMADLDLAPMRKKVSLATQPEQKPKTMSAPIFFIPKAPSVFAEWLPKVAVAMAVMFTVGGAVFASRSARPVAQPVAVAAAPPAAIPSALSTPVPAKPAAVVPSESPAPIASVQSAPATSVSPALVASVQPPPATSATPSPSVPSVSVPEDTSAAAQTHRPVSPAISQNSTVLNADKPPQSTDSVGIVSVAPGQTLLGICVKKFGGCTAQLLQQIHELNPSLTDPDHIESGQKIRVPVLAAQSSTVEQPRRDPSYEKGTHE